MASQPFRHCGLILLALLATPAIAHGEGIAVQLLFDGKPLKTTAPPQCSCHDDNRDPARFPGDYDLALTFETLSRAYWQMKDVDGAKGAILEGLRRFPDGWQADQLRRTLDRYEKGR